MALEPRQRRNQRLLLPVWDTELDKVVGFEIGGDDYLAKSFGMRELVAHARALLRRAGTELPSMITTISAGGLTLDEKVHTITGEKGHINLTARELKLMACLMKSASKAVHREDLFRDAWGWEYVTETKTVDVHIKRLRNKIEEAAGYSPKIVETVRGVGYNYRTSK